MPPPSRPKKYRSLLEQLREFMHDCWEKNSEYERLRENKEALDEFIDRKINEMANVDLLAFIDDNLENRA